MATFIKELCSPHWRCTVESLGSLKTTFPRRGVSISQSISQSALHLALPIPRPLPPLCQHACRPCCHIAQRSGQLRSRHLRCCHSHCHSRWVRRARAYLSATVCVRCRLALEGANVCRPEGGNIFEIAMRPYRSLTPLIVANAIQWEREKYQMSRIQSTCIRTVNGILGDRPRPVARGEARRTRAQ